MKYFAILPLLAALAPTLIQSAQSAAEDGTWTGAEKKAIVMDALQALAEASGYGPHWAPLAPVVAVLVDRLVQIYKRRVPTVSAS